LLNAQGGQPLTPSEQARHRQLRLAKRRATALLVVTSAVFVTLVSLGGTEGWVSYAVAAAEGSMVGGLADWFAVTALFRHPLGLPIPHTAIVAERKDQFAATLGEFVLETFLTPNVLAERVRALHAVEQAAEWVATPANAARLASEVTHGFSALGGVVREEDMKRVVGDLARAGAEAIPLAPLAGRLLHALTASGRLDDFLDAALPGLSSYLESQRDELRERLGARAPWWLPGAVEDRLFDRLFAELHSLVRDAALDRNHRLRRELNEQLAHFTERLEHSESLREVGEQFKRELLANAELQAWLANLAADIRERLAFEATDESSSLRRLLTEAIASGGRRVQQDPALQAAAEARLEGLVRHAAQRFDKELAELVTHTIARWDGRETAWRLELLLGPDLQFVRISGTVVGAAAGLAIHAVAELLA
jgi:uncharacterized membrane-anchored protein YjiN (DUF445 family)